jgi:hypothetical protein
MLSLPLASLASLMLLCTPAAAQAQKTKDDRRGDMTFATVDASSLCADCTVVQASGSFGEGTVGAYYSFVLRGGFKKNVYFIFDSPGGSMTAAIRLGEILRNLKARTVVGRAFVRNGEIEVEPARCASACVFAFLGGATRSMPKNSRLGVHSWMPVTLLGEVGDKTKKTKPMVLDQSIVEALHRQTAIYLKYLQTMGVDLRLAVLILQTPYSSISWVSARDQSLWSMVTVDSSLSTPADRNWPVLFLPEAAPPAIAPPASARARLATQQDRQDIGSGRARASRKGPASRRALRSKAR